MMMDIEIANEYQSSSNPRLLLVYFMAQDEFWNNEIDFNSCVFFFDFDGFESQLCL